MAELNYPFQVGKIISTLILQTNFDELRIMINGKLDAYNIEDGSLTTAEIAAHTITAANIAAGTITAAEIAANTITAAEIAANTITAAEIAANTITAAEIAAGTITATEIAAGTITAVEITVAQLSSITADMGAITAGTITLNTAGYLKGGQTGYDTGTGFFLGYSTGYKFSIGNSAGNKLTWNGTVLAVVGNITIQSGSSGYSNISDKPTSLGDINATEGTKLTGIEIGADITSTHTSNNASNYTGNAIGTSYTAAKCTNALADQTSANRAADIANLKASVSGSGFYATGTYLGFSDGAYWRTYMNNSGYFVMKNASNGLVLQSGYFTDGTIYSQSGSQSQFNVYDGSSHCVFHTSGTETALYPTSDNSTFLLLYGHSSNTASQAYAGLNITAQSLVGGTKWGLKFTGIGDSSYGFGGYLFSHPLHRLVGSSYLPVVVSGSVTVAELIQHGRGTISSGVATKAITFSVAYTTAPNVIVSGYGSGETNNFHVYPESTTGFTVGTTDTSGHQFSWIAIGAKS